MAGTTTAYVNITGSGLQVLAGPSLLNGPLTVNNTVSPLSTALSVSGTSTFGSAASFSTRRIQNSAPPFSTPGFVQEILDAASLLGREKFPDIRSIISIVGQPFVVPLMERLFAEENRSLRRFWFTSWLCSSPPSIWAGSSRRAMPKQPRFHSRQPAITLSWR